jgi:signal transduction histidine kinase/ActR/RegA family two-component response regulator
MHPAARRRRIRYLGVALVGLIAAVLAVATIVWTNIDKIQRAVRGVAEAQSELTWADAVLDAANDQQNALTGIVATHDRRFVVPFEQGQQRFDHAFARLSAYSLDDPANQQREMADAARLSRAWRLAAASQVAATQTVQVVAPLSRATRDDMSQVKRDVDDLRDGEARLLAERERVLAGACDATRVAMVVGTTAAFAFVLLILGLAARQLLVDRRRAEQAAQSLSAALERAQSAERTKARFLANMSHEMRTPLNGVLGMTAAMARTQLEPAQRELIDAIGFSASTLDHLIGHLIAVSRDGIEAPSKRESQTFRLGPAVRAMVLPFGVEAEAKSLAFTVEVEPAADVQVSGDAGALRALLACLLSNAIKFTDHGQVCVSVRRVGAETFGLEVSDTGVGFDATQQARMFETFTQEDDSDTRRFGGAGLGLAVARRLAKELGGTIEARPAPGGGSVFSLTIELAVASADTDPETAHSAAADAAADEPLRVLIVDDNPTNRKVLELILDQFGVDWVSVTDGQQAVDAARTQSFTAILMDIQMPVMDGLTATREIRRIEREASRPTAPIIIVSASCEPEHVEAGLAAGAQRHIGKPVSAQALIEALNDVLADVAQAAA